MSDDYIVKGPRGKCTGEINLIGELHDTSDFKRISPKRKPFCCSVGFTFQI